MFNKSMIPIVVTGLFCLVLFVCCTTTGSETPQELGNSLLEQGEKEFQNNNYYAAERLFTLAQQNYTAAGDLDAALKARNRSTNMLMLTFSFPYNRTEADSQLATTFPNLTAAERSKYLDETKVTTLLTDGEVMYSTDTVSNIMFHHPELMRIRTADMGKSPLYDSLMPLITANQTFSGPYGDPVPYRGITTVSISREELPENGTFRIWIPLPIETDSQTDVTIDSVEPAQYLKSMTGTDADIGIAYLEVPLEEFTDPFLNVTARYHFVQHEQRFVIDPEAVKPYNMDDPQYQKYTGSSLNIVITPEITKIAQEIVGNETNPYLQAEKIYWYIVNTYPYSHAPHAWLDATMTPEALYMLETGIGDCGTQSMFFASLCRSLGIPARATGGYQMIEGTTGTHFWAEYYLEGYGWIPVDVTVAEAADWAYNATDDTRHQYKEYFSQNLDPYRYIIQNNVDLPLEPKIDNPITHDMSFQTPRFECNTSILDPNIAYGDNTTTTVTKE